MSNMNCNRTVCQIDNRNIRQDVCLDNAALAMGYIPWQVWGNVYDLNKGMQVGTIFPCLDKPFIGRAMWK